MDKFTQILIKDLEDKNKKLQAKNLRLTKQLEIKKYQEAQMCKKTLYLLELLGMKGEEVIKLYEHY